MKPPHPTPHSHTPRFLQSRSIFRCLSRLIQHNFLTHVFFKNNKHVTRWLCCLQLAEVGGDNKHYGGSCHRSQAAGWSNWRHRTQKLVRNAQGFRSGVSKFFLRHSCKREVRFHIALTFLFIYDEFFRITYVKMQQLLRVGWRMEGELGNDSLNAMNFLKRRKETRSTKRLHKTARVIP